MIGKHGEIYWAKTIGEFSIFLPKHNPTYEYFEVYKKNKEYIGHFVAFFNRYWKVIGFCGYEILAEIIIDKKRDIFSSHLTQDERIYAGCCALDAYKKTKEEEMQELLKGIGNV